MDKTALFKISYGLFAITCNDGKKDTGLIVNTVTQVTDSPLRLTVTINKSNYSHDVIKSSGIMNVNCLSVDTPFEIFEKLGFHSGRDTDKLKGLLTWKASNGLVNLSCEYINAYICLKVVDYVDFGTHGMFVCEATDAMTVSDADSMTYDYYHKNVKPKPEVKNKKGYVCKVCGYVYEGESLPDDFVCPLCKHGASDFEPIK